MQPPTKQDTLDIADDAIDSNTNVSTFRSDLKTLKSDMSIVKHELRRQGLIIEEMQGNIHILVEGLLPLLQKSSSMKIDDQKILSNKDEISWINF